MSEISTGTVNDRMFTFGDLVIQALVVFRIVEEAGDLTLGAGGGN